VRRGKSDTQQTSLSRPNGSAARGEITIAAFDPVSATNTLLAALPAAARVKAIHYTQGGHWLLLWGWLVGVAAALIIARLGLLRGLREAITGKRPRPWLFSLIAAGVYVIADALLELPWSVYAGWWREKSYGLTSQPLAGWFNDQAIGLVISIIALSLFLAALYGLIRRTPRWWWAWASGLAALFIVILMVLSPVLIEPLFNTYTPAPPGPTRDAVVALAKIAGVPSDKIYIYNGSKQSNRYTANVSGLFGSARVAMSDVMFAKGADIAEVRGVVGHEMGHYKRGHVIIGAVVFSLLALIAFAIAQAAFPLVDSWVKTGALGIADPAGLPTLMIIFATLGLLGTPLTMTFTRFEESDADAFSLRVAHEPDGLSKALVKTIEYRADSPGPVEEFLFYDHPSVRRRVQRAMNWKAAHLTETEQEEALDAAASK
jgi:STE24 endopeptidase